MISKIMFLHDVHNMEAWCHGISTFIILTKPDLQTFLYADVLHNNHLQVFLQIHLFISKGVVYNWEAEYTLIRTDIW